MHIERLNDRRLLAATAEVIGGDELNVRGTDAADRIELFTRPVGLNPTDPVQIHVRFDGKTVFKYDVALLRRVKIRSFGGNDVIDLTGGTLGNPVMLPVRVDSGDQNDRILGSGTNGSTNHGGNGDDTIIGSANADLILGERGHDQLSGGAGNDTIYGGYGNDHIFGEDGDDQMTGGRDNDGLRGGAGADTFVGGLGTDTADYADRGRNVLIALGPIAFPPPWPLSMLTPSPSPGKGNAEPYPAFDPADYHGCGYLEGDLINSDVENAIGGRGDDVIWGSASDNVLVGNKGNDKLFAGLGNNTLSGGDGNDELYSANTTDGSLIGLVPGQQRPGDHVDGGAGTDLAIIDGRDITSHVETIDTLPFLTS